MKKIALKIIITILLLGGLSLVSAVAYQTTQDVIEIRQIYTRGESIEGTIKHPSSGLKRGGRGRMFSVTRMVNRPLFTFTVDDKKYYINSKLNAPTLSIGESVPVLYLPENPSIADIQYSPRKVTLDIIVEIGVALFAILVALSMLGIIFWGIFLKD